MIANALKRMIEDESTPVSVAQLAMIGECGESTVYEQIAKQDAKDLRRLRRWLMYLPPQCQQELLSALTGGRARLIDDSDLDLNRDGTIDGNDALDGAIALNQEIANALQQCRAIRDGKSQTSEQAVAAMSRAASTASTLVKVLLAIQPKRKSARLLSFAGANHAS